MIFSACSSERSNLVGNSLWTTSSQTDRRRRCGERRSVRLETRALVEEALEKEDVCAWKKTVSKDFERKEGDDGAWVYRKADAPTSLESPWGLRFQCL